MRVGFLGNQCQMRKGIEGGGCYKGVNFTQWGCCHSITTTDTPNVLGPQLGDGLESAVGPPGMRPPAHTRA